VRLNSRPKWLRKNKLNKGGPDKSRSKSSEKDGREKGFYKNKWMKKSKNNNKPTNNTSEKKSKSKKSCKTLLIANEGISKKKTSKRKKLSKTCWRPWSLKNRRDSKTLSWSRSKNKNTWLTWRNWIQERKLSRWPKKKRNRLKTKFSKN
jgi:hypothetical protein